MASILTSGLLSWSVEIHLGEPGTGKALPKRDGYRPLDDRESRWLFIKRVASGSNPDAGGALRV